MGIRVPLSQTLFSVAEDSELCFSAFHFDEIENRKKRNYLKHELLIMFGIGIVFARLNRSEQAERDVSMLWETYRVYDKKWADHFRYRTLLSFICIPGRLGAAIVRFVYRIAHKVVRFN